MKILLNIPFHTGKIPTHCLLPDAIKAVGGDLLLGQSPVCHCGVFR